jgi:beta-N-acetylhexosaminidase
VIGAAAPLAAGLLALAACGCAVGNDSAQAPSSRAADLGALQLAGQRVVTGFEGERPPPALRRSIRAGTVAGVILFEDNFDSRGEARRLAAELQALARPAELDDPLLIMVDQEGGPVRRIPGPPAPSAEAMGDEGTAACAREGTAAGALLESVGVNVDLAPVLDVARPASALEDEDRSFGRDPGAVGACAVAFAEGLERHGVAPTAKHFPGLGLATLNTDDALQRLPAPAADLREVDEAPYRAFLGEDGAPERLVMLSSAVYPAFGERPAALTRALATGELRGRLGFAGVSITDALETASTAAFGGPVAAGRAAALAGTDLLLFTTLDAAARAVAELRPLVRRNREGFEDSVDRVLALRGNI